MEIDKLNNAELLYHLRANFEARNIYTYVGANLLVVNPYKLFPELYSQELQQFYI
jgi:myosin heavy subunit